MRIEKEEIHENKVLSQNTLQITLDDDFNVSDARPDIDMIVKEKGILHIDTVKATGERAEITGALDFAILYTGKSESDKRVIPVQMTGNMPIQETVNLSENGEETYVTCEAALEDITVKSINSRKISVKAIVTLTVICEEIKDTRIGCAIMDADEQDQLQTKTGNVEYSKLTVSMHDNLRIKENFMLPASKPEALEILWEDVDVRSFNTRLAEDGIEITGELNVFLLYTTTEESAMPQWYETAVPFQGKIEVNGVSPEMISYVKYNTASVHVELRQDYDGENREIQVEMVLNMDIKVYEECENAILSDMYSPVKCVKNDICEADFHKLLIRNNSKCRAVERIKTGEYVGILQICNCTGVAQIDDITVEEDGLQVDGAIVANVFYITSDDNQPLGSLRAAVPFSNRIQVKPVVLDSLSGKMEYQVNAGLEQLSAMMTGSNEIEIKGVVGLDSICFEPCRTKTIMDCEVSEYEENEFLQFPSIIGYIATGEETLWDIAKKYHTTKESIKNGNRFLADRGNERIKRGDKLLLVKAAR